MYGHTIRRIFLSLGKRARFVRGSMGIRLFTTRLEKIILPRTSSMPRLPPKKKPKSRPQMCLHTRIRITARRPETRRPTKSFCSAKRKPILPPTRIEKPMPRVMPSKKGCTLGDRNQESIQLMVHVQTFTVHPIGGFGRLAYMLATPRTSDMTATSCHIIWSTTFASRCVPLCG